MSTSKCISILGALVVMLFSSCRILATESPSFGPDWFFAKGDTPPVSGEKGWQAVTVPHTWNAEDALHGGGTDMQSRDGYYRGKGWYRKTFIVERELTGRRIFVRFEGVGTVADVYLNEAYLGQHRGAFGAFCFELTHQLKFGETNELKVRADNSWRPDVAPLSGDFPVFGGIYRPVTLFVKHPVCITPLDYGSSGVFIDQKIISRDSASVCIRTEIDNSGLPANIDVRCTINDAAGAEVAQNCRPIRVEKNTIVTQQLNLSNPRFWHGRRDPYLYRVKVELLKDGVVIDALTQPLGLRAFRVDPTKGFSLNGQPYKLYGVSRHQDRSGKGWALTVADQVEDVELIREIGARAVRTAHYPNVGSFYDLCDQEGFLVWAELPLVDCITTNSAFAENAREQLTELIRQNYNHPSIFCWSIFNEMYHRESPDASVLIDSLARLCKSEDSSRLTTCAVNKQRSDLCNATDLFAINTYPGWYSMDPDSMGKTLEKFNELGHRRGVGISEYGAGGSIYQHEQNPARPTPNSHWHPEEWQAFVHERNYAAIQNADYCWGSFVWIMFDFASVWRDEGDAPGINDKGLVTYDRKTRKDAFYFYKANWSDEPVVYITSRRDTLRVKPATPVKIYSNAQEVTLLVNGRKIGTKPPNNFKIAQWDEIQLSSGENTIVAEANFRGKKQIDSCVWKLQGGGW